MGGGPVFNARLAELLESDAIRVLPLAALVIVSVLMLSTRSPTTALLILVPLTLSLLWLGGSMGVMGVPVSIMSLAIAPLVIGIGVDDGVHLLASWNRSGGDLREVFAETGVALLVTTLTTVAAFGALVTADTKGLVLFGWQAALALTFCLVATLFVLPPLCQRFLD